MDTGSREVKPEDYILSVLSPNDRIDAAFKIAQEAFRKTKLTVKDIDRAVKKTVAEYQVCVCSELLKEYRDVPLALEAQGKIDHSQLKALLAAIASVVSTPG
jgi:hypothetical protein